MSFHFPFPPFNLSIISLILSTNSSTWYPCQSTTPLSASIIKYNFSIPSPLSVVLGLICFIILIVLNISDNKHPVNALYHAYRYNLVCEGELLHSSNGFLTLFQ